MNRVLLTAVSALTLGVAGCHPAARIPTAQSRLDCPERQGELTRVSVVADGRTCVYRHAADTEVTLRLMPVKGDAFTTLAAIERELEASAPATPAQAASAKAAAEADAEPVDDEDAGSGAERPGPPEHTRLDLPGLHVDATEGAGADSDSAKLDMPGLHVDAGDEKASVKIGSAIHIDADEAGATVKMLRDVRLRGEALSREKRGVRATFVLARSGPDGGHSYVGYEAGGPKTGPLAIAVVRSNSDRHDDLSAAVKKLVRRNGGV